MTHPRIAMVTGATHGIGYEVSRRLAHQDTFVIVHGPTPREAHAAVDRLIRALRVTADDRIRACAVHPGTIDTGAFAAYYGRGGLRAADGAGAVLNAGDGFYYEGFMRADAAPAVYDDASVRHLWRASARLLGWDYAVAA